MWMLMLHCAPVFLAVPPTFVAHQVMHLAVVCSFQYIELQCER